MRSKQAAFSRRGAVLFLAVGAIAVLSILALGTTSSVLQELKLAKFVAEANTSPQAVFSALEAMKAVLAADETPQALTLYDLRKREFPLGDRTIEVLSVDEQARISLDRAPKEVLARLPGLSSSVPLVEDIFAADLAAKEDVLGMDGMTEEMYKEFRDLTTSFGPGQVNINTASPEVLECLGLDEYLVRKILEFRAGADGAGATEDDKFFSTTSEIVSLLEPSGLDPAQVQDLQTLVSAGLVGTSSEYVAFEITVKKGEKKERFFRVVIYWPGKKIVSWREG